MDWDLRKIICQDRILESCKTITKQMQGDQSVKRMNLFHFASVFGKFIISYWFSQVSWRGNWYFFSNINSCSFTMIMNMLKADILYRLSKVGNLPSVVPLEEIWWTVLDLGLGNTTRIVRLIQMRERGICVLLELRKGPRHWEGQGALPKHNDNTTHACHVFKYINTKK